MVLEYTRQIDIEFVGNLRDLGGYKTRDGCMVAWRRLFRSGELRHKTEEEVDQLRQETGLASVLDLRGDMEIKKDSVGLLTAGGINYHNVPLIAGGRGPGADSEEDLFARFTNMGEFYLFLMGHEEFGRRLLTALEIIADSANHPVLFHCTVGKDRTGVLSAVLLSILGVEDEDIITDYNLTTPHMAGFIESMRGIPQAARMLENLPSYVWEASKESMEQVLSGLRREHGSVRGYLEAHGGVSSLFSRLENTLLDSG